MGISSRWAAPSEFYSETVGARGFEPLTSATRIVPNGNCLFSTVSCALPLSYAPSNIACELCDLKIAGVACDLFNQAVEQCMTQSPCCSFLIILL